LCETRRHELDGRQLARANHPGQIDGVGETDIRF
jgi:hypothetical protein